MNIGQQILFSVSLLGVFNGFVLSGYLLLSRKNRSVAGFFLAILLLSISIRVGKAVFLYFNPQFPSPYPLAGLPGCFINPQFPRIILQIGLSACFLIGPAMYDFLLAARTHATTFSKRMQWTWATWLGIIVIGGAIVPYQKYPDTWNNIVVYIIYSQWMAYVVAGGLLLRKEWVALVRQPASLDTAQKRWLLIFAGNFLIFLVYMLSLFHVIKGMYISGAIAFSLILYITVLYIWYSAGASKPASEPATFEADKTSRRKIPEAEALGWIEKLERSIQEKQLYKEPNLKLGDVAQHINITPHLLSQLLNDNLGKSFSTYINEYRINEACRLIATDDRLTFEAIGYEVGYNSKSTFYAAFNKIKDTTPALFKQSIQKNMAG